MLNIIKSQLYGIVRDIYTYVCLLLSVILMIAMTIDALDELNGVVITGSVLFRAIPEMGGICGILAMLMFTSRLSGWDHNDKTINYEVLYGHKRSSVFFGRVLLSMVIGVAFALLFTFVPVIAAHVSNGWGATIPYGEALKRGLLLIPAYIRMAAMIVFLTAVFRNSWTSFLVGFVVYIVENIAASIWKKSGFALCVSCINNILKFKSAQLLYVDGNDVWVCMDSLSCGYVIGAVAVCVAETVLLLAAGALMFRKRDLS